MTTFRLLFLFTFLFTFCACQPESPTQTPVTDSPNMAAPEKISTHYYIRYIADEASLKAEATFFAEDGNQKKKARQFNGVMLGNSEMRLDEFNKEKPYYKLERSNEKLGKTTFRYINDKGHKEQDELILPLLERFTFSGNISRSKDNQLSWEGLPLGDKESLVLLFTNEQDRTVSTIVNGPTSEPSIIIDAEKTAKLHKGKNRVYIVRKNRSLENKTGADGTPREVRALMEYYSLTVDVMVVD
jgi:hypothetical protein